MQLATVNHYLRKIGLVLTLFIQQNPNGTVTHGFTLEKASSYDARIPNDKTSKNT